MEFLQQLQEFFAGLSARQRFSLVIGAVVVMVVLLLFVSSFRHDDYRTLYAGLSEGESQDVVQRLAARQIPVRVSADRSGVSVPATRLDEARLVLATGGMPPSDRLGFELFDSPNWGVSDFAEKVNFQRALEAEIERTIQTLHEIQTARVHLVLPKESLFAERGRDAKAAVVLNLQGERIDEASSTAITQLVAGAVEGLEPEKVTVVIAGRRSPPSEPVTGTAELSQAESVFSWFARSPTALGAAGAFLFLVLFIIVVISPILRQSGRDSEEQAQEAEEGWTAPASPDGATEEEIFRSALQDAGSVTQRAELLQQHLAQKIRREPEAAARLLQTWMQQPESPR